MTDPIEIQVGRVLDQAAAEEIELAAITVRADLDKLLDRAEHIAAMRAGKTRNVGVEAHTALDEVHDRLGKLAAVLEGRTQ